jgi:CheY-like chemotaxis protein
VEDHYDVRELMKVALVSFGYRVIEAANGWDAIIVATQEIPDLILMDIQMPAIDGFEATVLLHEHQATKQIPIIGVSAYSSEESLADANDVGIDEYLTKPIDPIALRETVSKYLGAKSSEGG